MTNKF